MLREVEVLRDGTLKGLEGEAALKCRVLVAHLIDLLITFIGEGLTLKLIHDTWPEMQGPNQSTGKGGYEQ